MRLSAAAAKTSSRIGVRELVEVLRSRIIRGDLTPGQRLTEERLASDLGVSRIPLREALRVLASEGFVQSQGYGGTFVATLDTDEAHDLLDVRSVLEPLAAAQAAMRCTPEHLEIFRQLLRESEQARREKRYEDLRTLKGRFHEHLAVASQNRTLIALMRVVRFKMEWATSIDAIQRGEGKAKHHRDIVDAIANRDSSRAATAAAAHINDTYASRGWRRSVESRYEPPAQTIQRVRRVGRR